MVGPKEFRRAELILACIFTGDGEMGAVGAFFRCKAERRRCFDDHALKAVQLLEFTADSCPKHTWLPGSAEGSRIPER